MRTSNTASKFRNYVRRITLALTSGGLWGVEGYEIDGDDGDVLEGVDDDPVEVFQGIGMYARPTSDDDAEGILLHVGGESDHPVIAALRNESARKRFVDAHGELAPGELACFNSDATAGFIIKADGKFIVFSAAKPAGEAVIYKTEHNTHIHPTGVGPSGVPSTPAVGSE